MKSLICREIEPLTGTQNRDTARMNYRTTHIYLDTDSSHSNFRVWIPADVLRVLDGDRLIFVFDRYMDDPGFETQVRIGPVVKLRRRTPKAAGAPSERSPWSWSRLVSSAIQASGSPQRPWPARLVNYDFEAFARLASARRPG